MTRAFRNILPPCYIIIIFAVFVAVVWGLDIFFRYMAGDVFSEWDFGLKVPKLLTLGFAAGIYGIFRVVRTFPLFKPGYYEWLSATPWTSRLPLPGGPTCYGWPDLVVLAVLLTLGWEIPVQDLMVVPIAMLIGHLIATVIVLGVTSEWIPLYLLGFATSLLVPIGESPIGLYAVILGLYIIGCWGHRRMFSRFPWDERALSRMRNFCISNESTMVLQKLLSNTRKRANANPWQVGWPFASVAPRRESKGGLFGFGSTHEYALCSMVGWWAALITFFATSPGKQRCVWFGCAIVSIALPLILCLVRIFGKRAPISILGRVRHRVWIIPEYDRVFLVAAVHIAVGLVFVSIMELLSFPQPLMAALVLPGVLLISSTSEMCRTWEFTGHYHLSSWAPRTPWYKVTVAHSTSRR